MGGGNVVCPPRATASAQNIAIPGPVSGDSRGHLGGTRSLLHRLPRAAPRDFIQEDRGMTSLVLVCVVVSFYQRRACCVGARTELFRDALIVLESMRSPRKAT